MRRRALPAGAADAGATDADDAGAMGADDAGAGETETGDAGVLETARGGRWWFGCGGDLSAGAAVLGLERGEFARGSGGGEGDLVSLHTGDEAAVDGGRTGAAKGVVGLDGESDGASGVVDVDDESVRGVFDGVGRADVGLVTVEDDGGRGEVKQEPAAGVFANHAEAAFGCHVHLAGVEGFGDHAKKSGIGARRVGRVLAWV